MFNRHNQETLVELLGYMPQKPLLPLLCHKTSQRFGCCTQTTHHYNLISAPCPSGFHKLQDTDNFSSVFAQRQPQRGLGQRVSYKVNKSCIDKETVISAIPARRLGRSLSYDSQSIYPSQAYLQTNKITYTQVHF